MHFSLSVSSPTRRITRMHSRMRETRQAQSTCANTAKPPSDIIRVRSSSAVSKGPIHSAPAPTIPISRSIRLTLCGLPDSSWWFMTIAHVPGYVGVEAARLASPLPLLRSSRRARGRVLQKLPSNVANEEWTDIPR